MVYGCTEVLFTGPCPTLLYLILLLFPKLLVQLRGSMDSMEWQFFCPLVIFPSCIPILRRMQELRQVLEYLVEHYIFIIPWKCKIYRFLFLIVCLQVIPVRDMDFLSDFFYRCAIYIYGAINGTISYSTISETNSFSSTGEISGLALLFQGVLQTTVSDCYFINNGLNTASVVYGSGIMISKKSKYVRIINSFFISNGDWNDVGGGFVDHSSLIVIFKNCTFIGNHAGQGGAINTLGVSLFVESSNFTSNGANLEGGAIICASTCRFTNIIFDLQFCGY